MHSAQSSPSPQLGKSTYSSGIRRDVLWNVVEPGDPYDIRKSMIAKMPGDQEHFMGDNLEIVCLLQSAQIQRLCQFLDDYKFRYREIERRELDRHSYQVQIKQLTQQLTNQGSFRSQNLKLKDFIKKQTFQIEQLKNNKHFVDNNLRANYESALSQIESLIKENTQFKSERQNFMLQIKNYIIRIEALESARDREVKQLMAKYNEESRFAIQNQTKSLKSRYQSQISRLQFQIKRLKEFNDTKNLEINQLNSKNRSLISQIQSLNSQKGKQDPNYLAQMQTRFALMGQQIQRLNLRIKESTSKIDESSRNQLYWKQKHQRLEQDYKSIQIRYKQISEQYRSLTVQFEKISSSTSQSSNLQSKYEDQIRQLNNQIRRLEDQRNSQSQKYTVLYKQYTEMEYNYSKVSVYERENSELKTNLASFNDVKRRVAQYETRIKQLTDELERERSSAKNNSIQRQGYDELRSDYQQFKRKSLQKERSISERYESEMQRKVLQYESRLAKYAEQSGNQFEIRLQAINREVERLNSYLKQKSDESQLHKKRIRQLENSINQRYEVDANRQVFTLESTIRQLKSQNEDLQRKIRDQQSMKRTVAQYENRIVLITQQIERLNYQLNLKTEENKNLKMLGNKQQRPDRESQGQGNEIYLRQEIVQLQRRMKQYEQRFRMVGHQNERINQNLRQKVDALNRSEANMRNMNQELQMLRKKKIQLQSSFNQKFQYDKMETSRKFTNYQQSLTAIQRQYDELRRRMTDMGNDSNKRVAEYENRIVLLSQEIERLNQTFKIKINEYQNAIQNQRNELQLSRRETRDLQVNITQKYELETSRKIGMYQQNMTGLSRELEDLKRRINQYENALRKKNEEASQLENRYRVVNQEYESFKMQVKSFEGEVNRSQSSYEQNMTRITRQYEDLKRRLAEYENRIALLSQQNERLNNVVRTGQQEQQNLKRVINQMKIEITQKYEIETSRKISGYQQNLSMINKQKQDMRRKIQQYETRLTNITRQLEDRNRKIVEYENKIRQLIQENEGINNKFRQLQVTVTQKYEVQTSRKITTYEQNIQNLGRELEGMRAKLNQYENLRINYEKEINRLNGLLKNSSEEHERLIVRMREVETSVTHKYETQVTRQFTVYEQNISNLNVQLEDFRRKLMNSEQTSKNQTMEIEQLRRRLKQFGDVHRAVSQYENKYNMLRQQFQRMSMNFKNKSEQASMLDNKLRAIMQENEELKRKIKQVEINIVNKYQFEINQKSTSFEQNLGNFKRQNQDLRRRIAELQNKTVLMTQQIQRLNNVLKGKVEELNQSELRGRNWQQEIENARRRIAEIQKSSNQRFQSQITRTVSLYEQNMTTITRQYDDFKRNSQRSIAELETKISLLSQQLERASQALRQRTQQLSQCDMRLKNAVQEIQKLQRAIKELEVASSKRLDAQKTTIISTYQQNFTMVTRQFESYKVQSTRKYSEYENKIALMTQELERLNGNLGKKVQDCNNLERRMMQLTQQLQNYRRQVKQSEQSMNQKFEIEVNRTIMTYEQNFSTMKIELETLSNKNKQLMKKIAEDALMVNEIERLNQVLRGKVDQAKHYQNQSQKYQSEIEKLKLSISGQYNVEIQRLNTIIRQKTQQYQLLQQKFSQFQSGQDSQFKQLQSSYSLVSKEYENSKKHLTEYQQSIRKLYSEFQRLQVIINELKVERQTLFDKNHGLLKQIERLTNLNNDQQSQISELRLKFSDNVALQKRINEHMALMVVLFAEIQTLRQRVKDKEKQVQEVRRSSLAPLKA